MDAWTGGSFSQGSLPCCLVIELSVSFAWCTETWGWCFLWLHYTTRLCLVPLVPVFWTVKDGHLEWVGRAPSRSGLVGSPRERPESSQPINTLHRRPPPPAPSPPQPPPQPLPAPSITNTSTTITKTSTTKTSTTITSTTNSSTTLLQQVLPSSARLYSAQNKEKEIKRAVHLGVKME